MLKERLRSFSKLATVSGIAMDEMSAPGQFAE